ncbi:hypothetical protein ACTFIW_009697 [Dictyostelium discoideum]
MRNKYVIVLFLFVLISHIYCSDPPKCITTKNVYKKSQVFGDGVTIEKNVQWWFLEQLGKSIGAIYTDNTLKGGSSEINEFANYNIRDPREPNPITSTYKQSLPNESKNIIFNSLTYNDQLSGGDDSAHAKGFFIWNENGGIHVIHSVPKSPEKGSEPLFNFMEKNINKQHAQHSVCITLSKEELHIIPKYIIYSNLNIQTINTVSTGVGIKVKRVSKAIDSYSKDLQTMVEKKSPGVIKLDKIDSTILAKEIPKTFKELDGLMNKYIFVEKKNNGDPDIWDGIIYLNKWSQLVSSFNYKFVLINHQTYTLNNYLILNKDITSSDTSQNPLETNVHYNNIYESKNKGKYFIQTTNTKLYKKYSDKIEKTHKDKIKFFILWHYIDNFKNGNNFKTMVHTQTKIEKGENAISQAVESIYLSYRFETPWSTVIRTDSGKDHSKMSYQFNNIDKAYSGGGGGTICFGDLNWHGKQEARGGGSFCSDEMKYLSEYFYRRVGLIRHPENDQYFRKDSLRLNSIAGQGLDLNVLLAKYPEDLKEILGTRKLDFETKVKGYGDDEKYYHLNPFIIVYNNEKDEDKLFSNGYNYGYDNVYIPLLTQLEDRTTNKYKSELFDFNVFPSINGEIILCDDNDGVTCSFEKSKSYQLFKDIYVKSTLTVTLKKDKSVNDETENTIVVPTSTVTPFPGKIYIDLKTVDSVKELYEKLKFKKNENIIQLKEVNIEDLEKFKFPNEGDQSDSEDGHDDKDYNEINKKICKAYPSNTDSKIIKYHPDCQDHLIYCILLTENKHGDLENINSIVEFRNVLGKYTENFSKFDKTKWCIKK